MEEGCDAMNVIDKLNQEFDVIMEKNIQLEKEKLELYKEIHKLKFKMICTDEHNPSYMEWTGEGMDADYYGQYEFDWSDDLQDAVEEGLEKNIILCEIYNVDEWDQGCESYPVLNHIDLHNGVRITIMG